jgi:hypothetical protein
MGSERWPLTSPGRVVSNLPMTPQAQLATSEQTERQSTIKQRQQLPRSMNLNRVTPRFKAVRTDASQACCSAFVVRADRCSMSDSRLGQIALFDQYGLKPQLLLIHKVTRNP